MRIVVRRESAAGERRVSAIPETVRGFTAAGHAVTVQSGAGEHAGHRDAAYAQAGAEVVAEPDLATAELLTHVRPLSPELLRSLSAGTVTVGLASPAAELDAVAAAAETGVSAVALELVPRLSRAQSMDALTSQALVSGYRCVLEAAIRFPRFFPLSMTAAGTIPPAKVLVLGAGVAGLQAIATAKRLGAKVSANDVRAASADEVRSVGGTFIHLDLEAADAAGGYAKELGADRARLQQELLTPHLHAADIVIATAAVPGRPAPRLVTAAMLAGMSPGSVLVDLAAESGGNIEGSRPGEDVAVPVDGGELTIVGMRDAPSTMPVDASALYARNVANLVALITHDGALALDLDDEVVAGALLTHEGVVRHAPTADALAARAGSSATGKGGA